jgi:hypothetical protein
MSFKKLIFLPWGRLLLLLLTTGALAMAGCDSAKTDGTDGLTYAASVEESSEEGLSFEATVTVKNERGDVASLSYGACPLRIQLYAGRKRSGKAVWDSRKDREGFCPQILYQKELGAKESFELSERVTSRDLENVAAGEYFVFVQARLGENDVPKDFVEAGSIVVDTRVQQ